MASLFTYPFPLFFVEGELEKGDVTKAWDNKGDISIGDGAIIGILADVTKDVPP